jgi:hypothetical protein
LEELESLVDRPEPREFAGGDRTPALAWVARHDSGSDSQPVCLYVTPLGLYGAPSGASLRIDGEGDEPSSTPPQFVRMVSDGNALYVVWKCSQDLCVVGLDRSW